MIMYKSPIKGWIGVTEEQKEKLVKHLYSNTPAIKMQDKESYINSRFKYIDDVEGENIEAITNFDNIKDIDTLNMITELQAKGKTIYKITNDYILFGDPEKCYVLRYFNECISHNKFISLSRRNNSRKGRISKDINKLLKVIQDREIKEELHISESATENNIEIVEHNAKLINNINNIINTIDNLLIIKNDTLVQQLKANYKKLIADINKSFIKDPYIIEDITDNINNNTRELNAIDTGFYYRNRLKSLKISDINYTLDNYNIAKLAKKYLNERYELNKDDFILLFENFVNTIDADKKELINNDSIFTFAHTNQTNLKYMNDLLAKNIIIKGFNYTNKNDLTPVTA